MNAELLARLSVLPDETVIEDGLRDMLVSLRYGDDIDDNGRAAVPAGVGALDADMRTLFWLCLLREELNGGPLHLFFTRGAEAEAMISEEREEALARGMSEAEIEAVAAERRAEHARRDPLQHADAVAEALAAAGLSRQHAAFETARGMAATQEKPDFSAPDAGFGDEDDFADAIAGFAAGRPAIAAWIAATRAGISDEARFYHLSLELHWLEEDELALLTPALKKFRLVDGLNGALLGGSLREFFHEAAGDQAPHVASALRDMGLAAEAAALERGIAMFSSPYPTDTEHRRSLHFGDDWSDLDEALDALTAEMDSEAIMTVLADLAKRDGIWPR